MQDKIRSQFDETLARHFERLIGTREGIAGLPLNLATISCLVLLAERELEIENVPSDAPERYTHHTLFSDAADVGIRSDDYLNAALQALAERGYVHVGEDGRLLTQKSVLSMARLLNLVFPKMPGMSFIAYAGQALDEVMTNRTECGSAIDRFDQTLKMQGISRGKKKPETGPEKRKGLHEGAAAVPGQVKVGQTAGTDRRKAGHSREEMLLKLRERTGKTPPLSAPSHAPDNHRIKAGDAAPKPLRRDDVVPQEPRRPGIEEELQSKKEEPSPQTLVEETIDSTQAEVHRAAEDLSRQEEPEPLQVEASEIIPEPPHAEEEENSIEVSEEIDDDARSSDNRDESAIEDATIESKILDFEKRLSLICPMCKERELKEKSTAAGKLFYVCSGDACGFISWGKPHHIECARCKNPFMVEAASASGEKILKCPRATCQHRRSLNPARKVVRRRVVRRK